MKIFNKKIIPYWIIIILLFTNIATIFSVRKQMANHPGNYASRCGRSGNFFGEKLDLNKQQKEKFREYRYEYRQNSREIIREMDSLRTAMFTYLQSNEPDSTILMQQADELGQLHSQLKSQTFTYMLNLKKTCTPKQRKKLFETMGQLTCPNDHPKMKSKHKFRKAE